jgi:hypothetical protein
MSDVPTSSLMTWFSRLKQTNYTTPVAANGSFRRLGEIDKVLFDVDLNFEPDMSNNGSDETTKRYPTTNIFEETAIPTYFSFQDIVYWLQMIMGSVASSGSAEPYSHLVTALNKATTRQHPVRTFGQRKGSDINIFPSVGIRELRIAKDAVGRLKVTITPHGSGKQLVNPASYTVPAAVTGRVFGYNNQVTHNIVQEDLTVDHNYKCGTRTWEWVFTNVPVSGEDDGFTDCSDEYEDGNPNSGQVRTEYLTGVYDWKFNATVRLTTDDPARTIMRQGALIALQTAIESTEIMGDEDDTPFSLTLSDDNAQIISVKDTAVQGGFFNRSIQCVLNANESDGLMSTEALAVNDVASYTV